jgi:hypothetical protein
MAESSMSLTLYWHKPIETGLASPAVDGGDGVGRFGRTRAELLLLE